jgi:hypothetical protein
MCLETIKKTYDPPKKVSSVNGNFRIGYKVCLPFGNGTFKGPYYGDDYRFGKWLYSDSEGSEEYTDETFATHKYEPGFHIFTTLKAAKKYQLDEGGCVFRVQYNDVVANGTHYVDGDFVPCVVARRMRVFKKDKVK